MTDCRRDTTSKARRSIGKRENSTVTAILVAPIALVLALSVAGRIWSELDMPDRLNIPQFAITAREVVVREDGIRIDREYITRIEHRLAASPSSTVRRELLVERQKTLSAISDLNEQFSGQTSPANIRDIQPRTIFTTGRLLASGDSRPALAH